MKTTLLLFCALVFAAGNATPVEGGSVTLIWTATGDNANSGCADGYELRYSPEKPDSVKGISVWWAEAISVDGPPGVPACAGEPDTAFVVGLPSGVLYFAVRAVDDSGNWTPIGNIHVDTLGRQAPKPPMIRTD